MWSAVNGSVSKTTGESRASSLVRYLPHTPQPNVCPRGKTKQIMARALPLAIPEASAQWLCGQNMTVAYTTPRVRSATLVLSRSVFGSKKCAMVRYLTGIRAMREQYRPLTERVREFSPLRRGAQEPPVRWPQEQGKRHDFGSEGHTHDTEERSRAEKLEHSATRPHGVRGLACTEPYANGVQV